MQRCAPTTHSAGRRARPDGPGVAAQGDGPFGTCRARHLLEVVGRFTRAVREAPQVDQRSGVSARLAIAATETVAASAVRRAAVNGEQPPVARVADLRPSYRPPAARSSSMRRRRAGGRAVEAPAQGEPPPTRTVPVWPGLTLPRYSSGSRRRDWSRPASRVGRGSARINGRGPGARRPPPASTARVRGRPGSRRPRSSSPSKGCICIAAWPKRSFRGRTVYGSRSAHRYGPGTGGPIRWMPPSTFVVRSMSSARRSWRADPRAKRWSLLRRGAQGRRVLMPAP